MSPRIRSHRIGVPGPPGEGISEAEWAAVADVLPRVAAVETAVDKGDKALSLKSAWYSPAADGTTDDRAKLQQMLDDGAGGTVTIAKGTYAIVGTLAVPASTEVVLQAGTVIEQKTKYTPVFDILNADDVVIRGNGALLRWTGSRAYTFAGGSVRGDDPYDYGAGVWSNGNRTKIHDLRVSGFTCGAYLSAWNGTTLGDYGKFDNEIHNLIVSNVDFGVLMGGQVNPVIRNVRGSYSLQTGSGNPSHLIYVTKTGLNRNLDVDGLRALNGSGGAAFQFKGVDGGKALNLHAYGCPGLGSMEDCADLDVDVSAANDLGFGETGSLMLFGTTTRCQVDVHIAAANTTTGYRMVSFDTGVSDTIVRLRGRQRQPANNANYTAVLRGTRNTLDYAVDNLDDTGAVYATARQGVRVMSGTGHTVRIIQARGVGELARVESGATNCIVEVDAARVVSTAPSQSVVLSDSTAQLRRDGLVSAAVTGPGQTVRIDGTRYRTVHVDVTTADTFTINTPYGAVPRGTRLTYIISNTSGGAMGTITWTGHTMATAWANPAAAQQKSIEFVYDGAGWKEIGRTA